MDTTQGIVIWGGQVQDMNSSQQKKSTESGTQNTCCDCMFANVIDMDFEDTLLCNQHNTYVTKDGAICSKFLKEMNEERKQL